MLVRKQLEEYLIQIVKERQKKEFFAIGKQNYMPVTSVPNGMLDSASIQAWVKCMAKGCLYATAKLGKDGKYKIYRSGQ